MSSSNCGLDWEETLGPSWGLLGDLSETYFGGSMPVSQSLVLDSGRDELMKAPVRGGKRNRLSEEKSVASLKSHSEAERRRRERINTNLNTLRGLVPSAEKMDKATLLAGVVSQVKQMKETALETSQGLVIPMDEDEIKVEPLDQGDGTFSVTASLSCEYRRGILSELRQTLNSLHLNIVKAEISTLRNWVRSEFVLASKKDVIWRNAEACQLIVESVRKALGNMLEKMSALAEYSPRTALVYNKRRVALGNSTSSSSREYWTRGSGDL